MEPSEVDETLESHGTEIGQRTNSLTRLWEWVLVDGNRVLIATLLSVAVFVLFLFLNEVGIIAFVNDDSTTRLAGGMIAGTFSLVTLVVSINQLILSREFAAAGEARDQLEGVMEFRRDVEGEATVPAAPASPTGLLELLVETIHYRAHALAETVADNEGGEFAELVAKYANTVGESTGRVEDTLERTRFGTFTALSAAIGYDDAWQVYAARHLRGSRRDSLSDETLAAFDELIDALQLFNVAREHFKTTYLQRELTQFSQLTIYAGVPAIISAMLIGFIYADFGGPNISVALLPYVVSALVAVVVSPLALLAAYILRTATVARRTASVGPMLPQKDPEAGPFDVSYDEGDE
ncbi:hypothetical protein [Natronococcus wangiae]|uniref:hypothetical protein n=1 Tax=Natronococcus wangiae TaxID=3068275 RepID=UPI00273E2EFD|nr:hypothetical protein [Natronococcus sp. AD5]